MLDMSATDLLKALDRFLHAPGAMLAALSLSLAGCSVSQPGARGRSTPLPQAEARNAAQLTSPAQMPEAHPNPYAPAPQHAQEGAQPKAAPATSTKGAQRLAAPNQPLLVRAREKTTPLPEPSASRTQAVGSAGSVTDAPVQALIVRGPPPQAPRPRWAAFKVLMWLGLGLAGAVLAVVARLCLVRRASLAALPSSSDEALRMPRELGFKEPIKAPE
jgi:hypothetical protein